MLKDPCCCERSRGVDHHWFGSALILLLVPLWLMPGCAAPENPERSNNGAAGVEGPLAKYLAELAPLYTPCSFSSKANALTISMNSGETALVTRRSVDSAILVQGDVCTDTSGTTPVFATSGRVKIINVQPDATSGSPVDLSTSQEVVIIDVSSGIFATASSATNGIFVDLSGGGDQVGLVMSKNSERIGCALVAGKDSLGFRSTTSADIKVTSYSGNQFIVNLGDGSDSFDKGNCTTQLTVYGDAGNDTFLAGTDTSIPGDHFHGGAGTDTLSYAVRTTGIVAVADGVTPSGDPSGAGEQDLIEPDVESLTGGKGDDTLHAAAASGVTHTLAGGDGSDILISEPGSRTVINGGNGIDTVDYSGRHAGIVVTIGDSRTNDGESSDYDNVGADIENLIGTNFNDRITGSSKANVITPGTGDDAVDGGDGDDIIFADASAPDGKDTIKGGKGNDTVDYSARAAGVCVVLDGASPSGACSFVTGVPSMSVTPADADIVYPDVECAIGTTADDHLVGNSQSNVLIGLSGNDWLEGESGDDQLDTNLYLSAGGNTCNPRSLSCIGIVTGSCDCATAALTASCSSSSYLDCGGDPLDIASCAAASDSQFSSCWKTQQ